MARMTLAQARDKAAEVERALARLQDCLRAEVSASSGYSSQSAKHIRQARAGQQHELDHAIRAAADLVAGLQGIGPARSGQIGGQRQGGHDTSAAALALVAPKAGTQRARVLDAMRHDEQVWGSFGVDRVGLTDVELSHGTGLPPNSLRPRRVELVDAGWLEDSGQRRKHHGREHVVWTLTEAARQTVGTTSTDRSTTP